MEDGSEEIISTDSSWKWGESGVRFSEIYDGEHCDGSFVTEQWEQAEEFDWAYDILIPQEGEPIREMERIAAKEIFIPRQAKRLLILARK